MKKTTKKKLVLAKETVRGLTHNLERAVGGESDLNSCDHLVSCIYLTCGRQMCDMQETLYPTCVA